MNRNFKKFVYLLLFSGLFILMLCNPQQSMHYAAAGLEIWFRNMIPALFPFMIVSGLLVRMGLATSIASLFSFFLNPILKVRPPLLYTVFMGFLCGFPMGARITKEFYERKEINQKEAQWLLAFCNNLGPAYVCGTILPLLQRQTVWPYVLGLYGIPMLYGMVLRYTGFRDSVPKTETKEKPLLQSEAQAKDSASLILHLDDAVNQAVGSILMLGGYMILFQVLQILPEQILCFSSDFGEKTAAMLSPVIEISGGITRIGAQMPLWCLMILPSGGLCCMAQTYGVLKGSGLSLKNYTLHKGILTLLHFGYYLIWYLIRPETFLR